ncbi:hypothetical protein LCGC14_2535110, partial [marine sediment metagenome]
KVYSYRVYLQGVEIAINQDWRKHVSIPI